jgi:hypothetical protein
LLKKEKRRETVSRCVTALIKVKWDTVARDYHLREVSVPLSSPIATKLLLKETAENLRLTVNQNHFPFPYIKLYLDCYSGNTFLEVWLLPSD